MLKLKRRNKYILTFLALFLLLISMAVKPLVTEIFGESILIKTMAYDPTDIFRGDYVQLNYEINEIELDKLDQDIIDTFVEKDYFISHELQDEKLYVSLVKNNTYYEVEKVSLTKPSEGIYIIGEYSYSVALRNDEENFGIRVEYPLDRFYVPENTGLELQEKIRNGEAFALIKVYRGHVVLKDVITK